jgi:hypothetical protein
MRLFVVVVASAFVLFAAAANAEQCCPTCKVDPCATKEPVKVIIGKVENPPTPCGCKDEFKKATIVKKIADEPPKPCPCSCKCPAEPAPCPCKDAAAASGPAAPVAITEEMKTTVHNTPVHDKVKVITNLLRGKK